MRRASTYMALLGLLLGLAVLGIPAAASAAPTVKVQAKIVPIPKNPDPFQHKNHHATWPNTGNILGGPTALEFKLAISGHEYPKEGEPGITSVEWEYGPPPLRRVVAYLPKGAKIHPKGFGTCPESYFARQEPEKCPPSSYAGPPGAADGKVAFGKEITREKVTVQPYFTTGGKLLFYIEGQHPASIETWAAGTVKPFNKGPFGTISKTEVPLITVLPEAPYAIAESISVKVGAAIMKHKKLISYGYLPKKCPKGGFPGKVELFFGAGTESSWSKVTEMLKVPCPKRSVKGHKASRKHKAKGHSRK